MDYSYIKIERGKSSKVKAGLYSDGNKRDLGFLDCDFSTLVIFKGSMELRRVPDELPKY